MEAILKADAQPVVGEQRLAALTAGDRPTWAHIRETVFAKGVNRASLQAIESAAFVLSLDDQPFEFDLNAPEKLDKFGTVLLHGTGSDRWFDKSFTLCIGSNGRVRYSYWFALLHGVLMYIFPFVFRWDSMLNIHGKFVDLSSLGIRLDIAFNCSVYS